jgi:hypothetical protein
MGASVGQRFVPNCILISNGSPEPIGDSLELILESRGTR